MCNFIGNDDYFGDFSFFSAWIRYSKIFAGRKPNCRASKPIYSSTYFNSLIIIQFFYIIMLFIPTHQTFTYFYLHALHFWLMVCPDWLCFDWSHNCIKFVETLSDQRVFFSISLYSFLIYAFVISQR